MKGCGVLSCCRVKPQQTPELPGLKNYQDAVVEVRCKILFLPWRIYNPAGQRAGRVLWEIPRHLCPVLKHLPKCWQEVTLKERYKARWIKACLIWTLRAVKGNPYAKDLGGLVRDRWTAKGGRKTCGCSLEPSLGSAAVHPDKPFPPPPWALQAAK